MARTEAQKAAQKRYREKHTRVTITIQKDRYKLIKRYAEQHGESFNAYAQRALWDMMSNYNVQDMQDTLDAWHSEQKAALDKQTEALEKRAYEDTHPYD